MIENINVHAKDNTQSAVANILGNSKSHTKAASSAVADDRNVSNSAEKPATDETFKQSMAKASEALSTDKENTESEADGNVLPPAGETVHDAAETDRPLAATSILPGMNLPETGTNKVIDLSSQSVSQLAAQAASTVNGQAGAKMQGQQQAAVNPSIITGISTDIEAATDAAALTTNTALLQGDGKAEPEANLLSSSIRQLLQSEPKSIRQNAQTLAGNTLSSTQAGDVAEAMLIKQADGLALKDETAGLLTSRGAFNAQMEGSLQNLQALGEIKNASLLQSAAANAEAKAELLPLSLSPATTTSSALPTTLQAEISQPFGRPAWAQGMSKQIVWMANQNIRSAEIRLNPGHLGPIEVRIDMSDDQINVAMSSRHAVVREAMEAALPKLREMLEQNGMNLSDTDISQHSFAEQREQNLASENSRFFSANSEQADLAAHTDDVIAGAQRQVADSMVDYYI